MASSKFNLYFNIFVFTIISGIVSLFLLLMLIFGSDEVTQYTALILTVEVGLVVNIVAALYRIYKYEKSLDALTENAMDNTLSVRTCPDYWTLKEGSGWKTCERNYVIPQGPNETSGGGTIQMQGSSDLINLADYNGHTLSTVCSNVGQLNTPWTDIRAACNAYNISMIPNPVY